MHNQIEAPKLAGVLGFFDDPQSLIAAAAKTRDSSWKDFDCFTPFAVHGLELAQGLERSKIPYITAVFGFAGTALAFLWQYAASKTWWAHIIGGKPFNSLPAFVPIIFEMSVLFGGIATFLGMLFFNRLPNFSKRAFDPSLTNNRFAIIIESPKETHDEDEVAKPFSPEQAESFLLSLGAKDVRKVYQEGWF
ncbi:MAG: DUF3341 domain-containing protein [Bdellovibrionales bacterium]|nr:DUF3341 domain-containing protein [Oligoflexia bacterium]